MPPYIYTASGLKYVFSDPDPQSIAIEDVAHQLALTNRWGGCTREPFSVAQHSCLMVEIVKSTELKKIALLHDATEAYIGDMPRPLKVQSPEFRAFEAKAWKAIVQKFGLLVDPEEPLHPEIKKADKLSLKWEAQLFMPPAILLEHPHYSVPEPPPALEKLMVPWHWKTARSTFLARFKLLFG